MEELLKKQKDIERNIESKYLEGNYTFFRKYNHVIILGANN